MDRAMPRDARLVRRNLFILPGTVLTLYGLLLSGYLLLVRTDANSCHDAARFLVAGKCYSGFPPAAILLLVGLALLVTGMAVRQLRAKPASAWDASRPGSPTHAVIASLATTAVLAFIAVGVLKSVQAGNGTLFVTRVSGYDVQTTFLFQIVAYLDLLVLGTLLWALCSAGQRRRKAQFLEAEVAPPRFPGEPEDTPVRPAPPMPEHRPPPAMPPAAPQPQPVKPLAWSSDEGIDNGGAKR